MEGSPYRKSSFSWKLGRSLGLVPGFLLAGTWSVPVSGTRGSGSCLKVGGNDTGVFFPNCLPLIAQFRHRTRGVTCALKSTGVAHSQQAPLRQDSAPSVLLSWVPLKPELVGTEIRTVDFHLNKESRRTLISQRSRISANTTRQAIRTRNENSNKIRNRKREQDSSYSQSAFERLQQGKCLGYERCRRDS
ncbi:hypothetical protein DY000_02047813 [Brassica cretica]|uniref:Uncharacterized protein n=1 Tax=Brassica cretica TaxID=69181 RepID=A0ABQ7EPS2_BRACR|nr:hypothetical protein DY000_02047813 [Brassica cretica]